MLCLHLTLVRQPRKLPVVLSKEEVLQLLEAAPGVKYEAALSVAYGARLRVSEVVTIPPSVLARADEVIE
jgi:integrase/recombinase XerD